MVPSAGQASLGVLWALFTAGHLDPCRKDAHSIYEEGRSTAPGLVPLPPLRTKHRTTGDLQANALSAFSKYSTNN